MEYQIYCNGFPANFDNCGPFESREDAQEWLDCEAQENMNVIGCYVKEIPK